MFVSVELSTEMPTATSHTTRTQIAKWDFGLFNSQLLLALATATTATGKFDQRICFNEIMHTLLTGYLQCGIAAGRHAGRTLGLAPVHAGVLFTFVLHHSGMGGVTNQKQGRIISNKHFPGDDDGPVRHSQTR